MKPLTLAVVLAAAAAPLALASRHAEHRDPRAAIVKAVPGATVGDVHPTPIPGLFEVMRGTDVAYVSADGRYAIAGDLYDLRANVDLTRRERRQTRLELLAKIPESQMLIFGAKSAPHTVTVFTDMDCSYCRKFHSQIAEYNRLGIRVRYVFFPRAGPNTRSWVEAEQVWCSPNRKAAFDGAKPGQLLHVKVCTHTPIPQEYELAQQLGLVGTPSIILGNGDLLSGYVSPADLAQTVRPLAR